MSKPALFVLAASLFAASNASADDLSVTKSAPAPEPHASITTSPLHLFLPMVEFTGEVRLADKLGIAAIGGVGAVRDMSTNARITLLEGGTSVRYYPVGSFRKGIQLGAEALYVHAFTKYSGVDIKGEGLALSPFAGAKWTHSSGFTLEGQLGASFMVMRAKADTGQMNSQRAIAPMLNLQVGYSF